MIDFFRVQNFVCFKDLQIEGLNRINLFVGKPNTGKTALLEAFALFFGIFTVPRYIIMFADYPFHNFDSAKDIILSGGRQGKVEKEVAIFKKNDTLLILTTENGRKKLSNLQLTPKIYHISTTFIEENKDLLLKFFRLLDSDIVDFLKVKTGYRFVFENGSCIPVSLCGESFGRALEIFYLLKTYKVAVVDNIETCFHPTFFPQFWEFLNEHFKDCQIFATTYSYELITTAPSDTSLYRLEKPAQVIYYSPEHLQSAIQIGLEIR